MAKPKTLEQLRAEKERAETRLAQEQHKLNRLENRKKFLEQGERKKRTHRLCNLGGTIESLAPEVKDLTRTEMTELMEQIFSLSEVQQAVRHMAITHINQASRGKELKADLDIRGDRYKEFTAVLKELIGYEGTLKLYEKEKQLAQKFASFFPEQTSEQDRVAAFLSQDVTLIRQDYIQTFSPPPDPRKKKRSRRE